MTQYVLEIWRCGSCGKIVWRNIEGQETLETSHRLCLKCNGYEMYFSLLKEGKERQEI